MITISSWFKKLFCKKAEKTCLKSEEEYKRDFKETYGNKDLKDVVWNGPQKDIRSGGGHPGSNHY